jgi:hypothetical protein
MSAISGSNGVSGLFQYYSQISGQSGASGSQATQAAGNDSDGDGDGSGQSSSTSQVSGHHHHHGGGGFFKKIESAVTSALQNSKTDGSTDINQTIKDAIAQALKDGNGTSLPTGTTGTPSTNDPDGDGDVDAAGQPDSDGTAGTSAASNGKSAFFQTLQQYGIDPQQFRQDLMAAMQSANGGNGSGIGQELPTGMVVDTTA